MSNTPSTHHQQEEIDLGYLLNKINKLFKNSVKLFFELIAFFIRFKFIVLTLLIFAIAYGFYKDSRSTTEYDNKAIVIPNFESVDYMYGKADALNAKIQSRDTIFLKEILGQHYRRLRSIEVEPIVDLYNFISKSRENIDIFRIFIQSQDVKEYMDEFSNSKYYKYHTLSIRTVGDESSAEIFSNVMHYLNDSEHYSSYAEIYKASLDFQIKEYDKMIKQFDTLISSVSLNNQESQGVAVLDFTNLHLLFERKRDMLDEKLELEKKLTDYKDTIKLVDVAYNLETDSRLSSKIKYPIFVILGIIFFFFALYIYNRLKRIANEDQV